jgi:hypothetical protein
VEGSIVSAPIAAAPAPRAKPPKEWLTRRQAANYLTSLGCQISHRTLANLAANNNAGKGPPYTALPLEACAVPARGSGRLGEARMRGDHVRSRAVTVVRGGQGLLKI